MVRIGPDSPFTRALSPCPKPGARTSRVRSDPPGHPGGTAKTTPRAIRDPPKQAGRSYVSAAGGTIIVPIRSNARPVSSAHRFVCDDAVALARGVGDQPSALGCISRRRQPPRQHRATPLRPHRASSAWPVTFETGRQFAPAVASDGTIYLVTGDEDGQLVALDRGGHVKPGWPIDEEPGADFGSPAVGPDGSVHVEECAGAKVGCRLAWVRPERAGTLRLAGRDTDRLRLSRRRRLPAERPGHRTRRNRIRVALAGRRRLAIPRRRPFGQGQARVAGRIQRRGPVLD